MKKLIILVLIMLPLATIAQKKQTTTVANFFNKYCESQNYSSIEVTEDMFKMFDKMEDADSEMVTFLKKLKYVRYMEYEPKSSITVTGVSNGKENTFFVDGQQVTTTSTTISSRKSKSNHSGSVTKVTANTPDITLNQSGRNSVVYSNAMKEINFSAYKQLMKSNQDGDKLLFLRRQYTSSPNDQEFILINGNTLIQIRGDINIKHLYELDDILEAIGEILPM